MFLHGKNQLEKGFSTFILPLRFVHVFRNLHITFLLPAIICIFLHPVVEGQVVEVDLKWDEPSSSFKVDGINKSNFSVYEGNAYRFVNESGSEAPISIFLNGDEYSQINPFNSIANNIRNYLYWEPRASDAREVEIVNLNKSDSSLIVTVDSHNYSQTIESPAEVGLGANFGYSLHLVDENSLIVGAPAYENEMGRVLLYQFSEVLKQYNLTEVINPTSGEDMQFGGNIDASGDWLAVASPWTNSSKGRLELFKHDDTGYLSRSLIDGHEIGDFLGIQVSMQTNELAVSSIGKVDLYSYAEDLGSWIKNENQTIVSNKDDGFGLSLDYSSDSLIVGAPFASGGGVAYIYKKGLPDWAVNTLLPATTAGESAQFGFSSAIDLDAALAAVSAPFDDTIGSQSGAVYTYQLVDDVWEEIEVLFPPDFGNEKRFGYSIDLEGNLLSIISPGSGTKGNIFLFRFIPSNREWSLVSSLDFAEFGITDSSNCDVKIDGKTVVLGFPDDRAGSGTVLSFHGPGWRAEPVTDLPPLVSDSTLFEFNITEDTNTYFVYDFNGTHPFDQPVFWSIESENAFGQSIFELNSTTGVFRYIPDANFSGVHSFRFKLASSENSSSFPITLNVQNINDAPVFKEMDKILPDASVGISYEYNLLWEDADNELPFFSIVPGDNGTLPDGLALIDGKIIGVPAEGGDHDFTIRMEDSDSLFVDKNFSLRVLSPNSKPIVLWDGHETSRVNIRLKEDFSHSEWINSLGELSLSDPDEDDIISVSVKQNPKHGTLIVKDLEEEPISYFPQPNYSGMDRFTVFLSDGRDTIELEFIVTIDPVNDAPILIANEVNGNVLPRPLELNVSEAFRHVFAVSDPDIGDRVKLTFSYLPEWLNFDGNFTLEGTPWTKDFLQDPTPGIYVYVTDLLGASTTQYFEFQLKPKDYPPKIDQEGSVNFTMVEDADTPFEYSLTSTDQDSEVTDMNWSVTVHPSHGTINLIGGESSFNAIVEYTPFPDYTGKDTFEITVYNKSFADASDSITFNVDVNSSNDAPQIISAPFTNLLVGVPWDYELQVYDPDKNDEFSLEVLNLPHWLKYNEVSKGAWLFHGIPNSTDSSPVNITLKVTDSFDLYTEQSLELFLFESAEQVELNPSAIEIAHINEDSNWSIGHLSVSGANNRKINWSFVKEADFGSVEFDEFLNGTIQNLIYIPDPNFYGVDMFTIQASDGFSSDEINFEVNVEQVDDFPEWNLPQNLTIEDEEFYDQNISYSDGDGLDTLGNLDILISPENNWLNIIHLKDQGVVRLYGQAPSETNSSYIVNTILYDLKGEVLLEGNFTIDVKFFNHAPELLSSSIQIGPIYEDKHYSHTGSMNGLASDKESGQQLSWSVSAQPKFGSASILSDGSSLSYFPFQDFNGLDSFKLQVVDGGTAKGKAKSKDIEVSILVEAVKDLPFFKSSKSIQVFDGVDFQFEIEATDPDLPSGVFPELRVVSQLPYWIDFHDLGNGTGLLSGHPMFYHEGDYLIEIQCSDQDGEAITEFLNIEVKVEDYPPNILSDPGGNIVEEIRLIFREDQGVSNIDPTFYAVNPDKEEEDLEQLEWNIENYPSSGSGLVVAGSGSKPTTFSYTLTKDFSGTDQFSISVSEGDRKSFIKFEIIVLPEEDSPVWQTGTVIPPRIIELTPGAFFDYEITAADPDGDPLQYELTNYGAIEDEWLQVARDQERTFLRGIVPSAIFTKSSYPYLLKISDPSQRSIFAEFEIVVSPPNHPPEILFDLESVSVLFDYDGSSVNSEIFPVAAEDVNGDSLLWSIGSPPKHGSVKVVQRNGKILKLRYTPSQEYVEHDLFTLRVSDGYLSDDIEVIAFLDRPQTKVNLPQRLPPVLSGEYFFHEFTIFSNFGFESLDAQLINPPSWINPLVIKNQPEAQIKKITLSGIAPHNSQGEETLSIQVSNSKMEFSELNEVTVPVESRNSNISNLQISVLHEDQSLAVDERSIEIGIQEFKKHVPLTFQGKIYKVLTFDNKIFVVGNFWGEILYSGELIGFSEKASSFVLLVDSEFNLLDKKLFDSSVVCTIVDAVLTLDNELLVLGNYNGDVSISGVQIKAKGESDLFLALLKGDEDKLVVKKQLGFGGRFNEIASALAIDNDRVFICGSFSNRITLGRFNKDSVGLSDGFIASTSLKELGEFSWLNTYGSTGRDTIRDLIIMNGSLYFVANFENSLRVGANFFRGEGNKSSFCARLNPSSGSLINSYKLVGDGNIAAKGILGISPKNKIIIMGEFDGEIISKSSTAESLMLTDLFLIRLSGNLTPELLKGIAGDGNEQWTNWMTSGDGDVYLSGIFNKSINLSQSTIFSKGFSDSFLLKIDDSSLGIIDYALVQSAANVEVPTILHSSNMGVLMSVKSSNSFVYSNGLSNVTIGEGNNYLLHLENSPKVISNLPLFLPLDASFYFPFESVGWKQNYSKYQLEIEKIPEWMNLEFDNLSGTGYFTGITPLASDSVQLKIKVLSDSQNEEAEYSHAIDLRQSFAPFFIDPPSEIEILQGEEFTYELNLYDHDANQLWLYYDSPQWFNYQSQQSGKIKFRGITDSSSIGTHQVNFRLKDDYDLENTFSLFLKVNAVLPEMFLEDDLAYDTWIDSWLGKIFLKDTGWAYHINLGWVLLKPSKDGDFLWLWNENWGWMWTSKVIWSKDSQSGHLYSQALDSWLYFMNLIEGKPLIFRQAEKDWVDY